MNKILNLLSPTIEFVRANMNKIAFVSISLVSLFLGYLITVYSLKKLKSEVFSYYPFDKFFPKSGSWSVIYFLITILLLGALVYAIIKGGFYLGPA